MKDRLKTIADMVTKGNSVADIGTDHAFLPIELIRTGKCPYAIAMDIVEGPLQRAQEHINTAGLSDQIECRLSDGFEKLELNEVDTAVIAGMGGDLIARIISEKPGIVNELIVSPHTHHEKVRIVLREYNYQIIEERMIVDMNKYYVFIKAVKDEAVAKYETAAKDETAVKDEIAAKGEIEDIKNKENNENIVDNENTNNAGNKEIKGIKENKGNKGNKEIIVAQYQQELYTIYDYFGKYLIEHKDPVLKQYLLKEAEKFNGIAQKSSYLGLVEEALTAMR